MKLSDSDNKYITEQTQYYYNDEEKLKGIFTSNKEIFGLNFYSSVRGNDFNTRIINLVEELVKTSKLYNFIEFVKKEYSDFCKDLLAQKYIELIKLCKVICSNNEKIKELIFNVYTQVSSTRRRILQSELRENKESVEEIIKNLLSISSQTNEANYFEEFIIHLLLNKQIDQICAELKEKINIWAENNISDLEEKKENIKDKYLKDNPCLMLAINENKNNNQYIVQAWLIKNINQYNSQNVSDCEALKIEDKLFFPLDKSSSSQLPAKLEQIVRQLIQDYYNKTDEDIVNIIQQIHIFLPYKLMNCDCAIDCWKEKENDDSTETIGENHEVVIRLTERLRAKNPEAIKWRNNKGKMIKSKLEEFAQNIFALANHEKTKSFEKQFKDDKIIAVKITKVFPKNHELGQLLWQGSIPIALWIREEVKNTDYESEINKILSNNSPENSNESIRLKDIPQRVKSTRLDAIDYEPPENHIGRHLCLLWDDPNFVPPKQLLTEINL